jgi:type IV secretion system protein VirB2
MLAFSLLIFYVQFKRGYMTKKESLSTTNMSQMQTIAFCLCLAVLLTLLIPNTSFASSSTGTTGSGDAIASVLCTIVTALTGTIGKAVATIAVVVLGIGLFLGKLSWPLAVATAIGIGMIFGATDLVNWISTGAGNGTGSGGCTPS